MRQGFVLKQYMDKAVISDEVIFADISKFLGEGKEVRLNPKGNSMLPFIRPGKDSIILAKREDVFVGDIVFANVEDKYVVHRVIEVNKDAVVLMGDGNLKAVEKCTKADILGTVRTIIRSGTKHKTPGKAVVWRKLKPVRRYLLALYKIKRRLGI